jgi:menaquinone-dependent protoporphyrinogen IX oxidase
MKVLFLYYTKTGHTLEAAEAVCEGLKTAGCQVDMVNAAEFNPASLESCDAMIVGSPCWGGSYGQGVSKPVRRALEKIGAGSLAGKPTGGISVNGNMGADNTIKTIGEILVQKGCGSFIHGPIAKAGAPLSLWTGPAIKPEDLERFRDFGRSFAAMVNR